MTNFSITNLNKLINALGSDNVLLNEPLSQHTWMKVGGPADLFFIATTLPQLKKAVTSAIKLNIPYFILGGGSNILVRDGGIRGLVIKNQVADIKVTGFTGRVKARQVGLHKTFVSATSGTSISQLVNFTLDHGLAGLELFLGVPGTVGGAIYNNAHYQNQFIGNYVAEVLVLDRQGQDRTYSQADMQFAYDYSILHQTHEVVLSAIFSLTTADSNQLKSIATQALNARQTTQPLDLPSSGCMFKNLTPLQAQTASTPNHTTSAGFLIDQAGLKGHQIGGAMISPVHANFIVNTGKATASDILKLASQVADLVKQKYSVTLEKEVFVVGED